MGSVFALVDCNNFYASCETLFRPDLKNRPVVILSNNDGCVVARSKEAKALDIKMGSPVFKVQSLFRKYNVVCFSSNYALYADMSNRVMSVLEAESPIVELYSIDEAFLDLSGMDNLVSLLDFGKQLKSKVDQYTGIQVCIGIAPTKTLAKLANYAAKKYRATGGVVDLMSVERQRKLLALVDVSDVWGVGRKLSARLKARGIESALDLATTDLKTIRNEFSVVLERTARELNGTSCLSVESKPMVKQQILCSRSFSSRITNKSQLREMIAKYVSRAAEKLRQESRFAKVICVFIRTSAFSSNEAYYSNSMSVELVSPTSDTRVFIDVAEGILDRLWRSGYRYAKAGVILMDFHGSNGYQYDFFDSRTSAKDSKELMSVVDQINASGKGKVFFGAAGTASTWTMKQDYLSPSYTTNWQDIPKVK